MNESMREARQYFEFIHELPGENTSTIVGDATIVLGIHASVACFKCPCGCGVMFELLLSNYGENPWDDKELVSFSVELGRNENGRWISFGEVIGLEEEGTCKSRFGIRRNRVIWNPDNYDVEAEEP